MRLKVSEVVEAVKKFVREQGGYVSFRLIDVKADEPNSQWIVIVDVGLWAITKKEITIDDSDGNVIGYKSTK